MCNFVVFKQTWMLLKTYNTLGKSFFKFTKIATINMSREYKSLRNFEVTEKLPLTTRNVYRNEYNRPMCIPKNDSRNTH